VSIAAAALTGAIVDGAFARPGIGPRIFADETGYLAIARLLGHGGNRIDMSGTASYSPGFALFAAIPSRLLRGDAAATYRVVVILQIALIAVASYLLGLLVHRLLRTGPLETFLTVLVASCLPSLVFNSGVAWSESFLYFALVSAVFLVHTLLARPRRGAPTTALAIGAGGAVGLLEVIHQRTTLLVLAILLLTVAALGLRGRWAHALSFGVAAVLVVVVGAIASRYATQRLWPGGVVSGSNEAASNLADPGNWKAYAEGAVGELWSLTAGTVGLAVTGLVVGLGICLRRPGRDATGDRRARLTALLRGGSRTLALLLIAPLLLLYPVSVLFISTGSRGDQFVYGRYLDVGLPLVVALGIAGLLRASGAIGRRLLLLVGVPMATLVGSYLVADAVGTKWLRAPFNSVNTINILWYTRSGALSLAEATAVCAVALLLIGAALVLRDRFARSTAHVAIARGTSVAITGIVLVVFALQLARVSTLNDLLGVATRDPKAVAQAIRDHGDRNVRIDPKVAVQDRLAIQFWTPDVHSTTAKLEPCGLTVMPSDQPHSAPDEKVVASAGRLVLIDETCR
jgi:hypothetical protein